MSLNPENTKYDSRPRVNAPQGKHIVRNYAIIDIGTQMESFKNQPPVPTAKVMLFFEFPKLLHVFKEGEAPQPLSIFHEYTNKASDRGSLTKVVKAWGNLTQIPKVLNLKPYLGRYCEIIVEHKPKKSDPSVIYANIADGGKSVSPVVKSIENPQKPGEFIAMVDPTTKIPYGYRAFNTDMWFDLDKFTWDQFKSLPKFVQEKIRKSVEWPSLTQNNPEPMVQQPQTNFQQDAQAVVDPNNPDF